MSLGKLLMFGVLNSRVSKFESELNKYPLNKYPLNKYPQGTFVTSEE